MATETYGEASSSPFREDLGACLPANLFGSPARNSKPSFPFDFPYETAHELAYGEDPTPEMLLIEDDDFIVSLVEQIARSALNDDENAKLKHHRYESGSNGWPLLDRKSSSAIRAMGGGGKAYTSAAADSHVDSRWRSHAISGMPDFPIPRQGGRADDAWDLLQAAASEVARIREYRKSSFAYYSAAQQASQCVLPPAAMSPSTHCRSREDPRNRHLRVDGHGVKQPSNPTFCNQPVLHNNVHQCSYYSSAVLQQQQQQQRPVWSGSRSSRQWSTMQDASGLCPRAGFPTATNKSSARESGGTGVFLPRRYGASSDSGKKKPTCLPVLPARLVQVLNLNAEDMLHPSTPTRTHLRPSCQPKDASTLSLEATEIPVYALEEAWNTPYQSCPQVARLPAEWTY